MAINNIDRGGLHWKGKLAPHVWFANFYSNPFILFVGYYSFLHQGPGGGERWENVGPFPLPKASLCFSRFFAFWLNSEGYATKPLLVAGISSLAPLRPNTKVYSTGCLRVNF